MLRLHGWFSGHLVRSPQDQRSRPSDRHPV